MPDLLVRAPQKAIEVTVRLPASKSESNRALIMQALAYTQKEPAEITIQHLSNARDTQILKALLSQNQPVWDVQDAGTTMRFLTALAAVTNQSKSIQGTARMHERPIGVLVEALKQIGFQVAYTNQMGFPPLQIQAITPQQWSKLSEFVKLSAQVSSQFISALLMIAPLLPNGLTIALEGDLRSAAYVEMTIAQMQQAGIYVEKKKDLRQLYVAPQPYQSHQFVIEADWSAASYWFSMVALCPFHIQVLLEGLQSTSLQGDAVIQQLMQPWGVISKHIPQGVLIQKEGAIVLSDLFFDFSNCPDLAQTVLVCVAASKANATIVGLESLRIKETDRIAALQTELAKFNAILLELDEHHWQLIGEHFATPQQTTISTYHDHRMAMAFAPLSFFCNLVIENKAVVEKSYPHFWSDLQACGFQIEELIVNV